MPPERPGQSTAMLTQQGMGYMPMAEGIPNIRPMPTDGFPFTGTGMGQFASMAATPYMNQMFGQVGMTAMGVGHDQNVYDRLMRQRFSQMQMRAMQIAAEEDRRGFMQLSRGMAALTGTPFGAAQYQAAQSFSNAAVMFSPMFAEIMPETLDQMGGLRGSATVMTNRMMNAGRYRSDPVTGRMGMSAESTGAMAQQIFRDMYSHDNMGQMHGVSAGQLGGLTQQLQSRGMLAGSSTDIRAQVRAAIEEIRSSRPGDIAGIGRTSHITMPSNTNDLSSAQLDSLSANPMVEGRLRAFDAERVRRSLSSYVGAVSAMRDIFGDMGHPNAPMTELMSGLEALTAGSMAQLSPQRLGVIARQTHNLARQTGVSMDGALMLQQHAGARAQQLGLEPIFGVHAAQAALAFAGAYRERGVGANTSWGAPTSDQVAQLTANLHAQASASGMANRLNAALRMNAGVTGGFQENSAAGRYIFALQHGLNEFQREANGPFSTIALGDRDFRRMFTNANNSAGQSAGITDGYVQSILSQVTHNREYDSDGRNTALVRRAQGRDELQPFISGVMQTNLTASLQDAHVPQPQARAAANAVASGITQRIMQMSEAAMATPTTRNQGISNIIREELTSTGHGNVLAGMTTEARDQFLTRTADRFFGATNNAIEGSSLYSGHRNFIMLHRVHNDAALNAADRQAMTASFRGQMQEAMAPLGHGSMLTRFVEAVQTTRSDDPQAALRVMAQTAGGVSNDAINSLILPKIQVLAAHRRSIVELQTQLQRTTDPAERNRLHTQLDVAHSAVLGFTKELAQFATLHSIYATPGLDTASLQRMERTSRDLSTARDDTVGLRGGFGDQVTAAEIATAQRNDGNRAGLDLITRTAVLVGRQKRRADALSAHLSADRTIEILSSIARTPEQDRQYQLALTSQARLRTEAAPHQAYLDAEILKIRTASPGTSAARARDQAVANMQHDYGTVNTNELDNPDLGTITPEDARTIVRTDRRRVPSRATEGEIQRLMTERNMSRVDAYDLANAQLRARHLGLTDANFPGVGIAGASVSAINDAFAQQARDVNVINPSDRTDYIRLHGEPSSAELERFRTISSIGADVSSADLRTRMIDNNILRSRQDANREQFTQFWRGASGSAARMAVDQQSQDVADVAMHLIRDPGTVRRIGARAIEYHETLTSGQRRLRELARFHTNGDMARLMFGHYNISTSTPEGRDTAASVTQEISRIIESQREVRSQLAGSTRGLFRGAGLGRQIGDGNEEARRLLRLGPGSSHWGQAALAADVEIYRGLTSGQQNTIANANINPDDGHGWLRRRNEEADELATTLGVPVATIMSASRVARRLDDMRVAALSDENETSENLVRTLLGEYGGGSVLGERNNADLTPAGLNAQYRLGTPQGREFGQTARATARTLRTRAASGARDGAVGLGAVDQMAAEYQRIMRQSSSGPAGDANGWWQQSRTREDNIRGFQQRYGFMEAGNQTPREPREWREFTHAMEFQQRTGLLQLGRPGLNGQPGNVEADLLDRLNRGVGQGDLRAPGSTSNGGLPSRMELFGTLSVNLVQGTADLVSVSGSTRDNTPNPA